MWPSQTLKKICLNRLNGSSLPIKWKQNTFITQITHKILPNPLKLNLLKPLALISLQDIQEKSSMLKTHQSFSQPNPECQSSTEKKEKEKKTKLCQERNSILEKQRTERNCFKLKSTLRLRSTNVDVSEANWLSIRWY